MQMLFSDEVKPVCRGSLWLTQTESVKYMGTVATALTNYNYAVRVSPSWLFYTNSLYSTYFYIENVKL